MALLDPNNLPPMQPGESSMQYMLRIGMDPNQASSMLAQSATGNSFAQGPSFQNQIKTQAAPRPELGWFGGPTVSTPVQVGAPTSQWAGNTPPATQGPGAVPVAQTTNYPGGTSAPAPGTASYFRTGGAFAGTTPPTANPLANRGGSSTAAGALATAATGGGAGGGALPPMNPGESSMDYMLRIGMNPAQAQAALAMSQQNPGMSFQDIMARMGGNTASGPSGALPPINPGEDSMAYMTRIGMSPADAQRALAISKANPGMSFQDIIAQMRGGGAGGGGTGGLGGGGSGSNFNLGLGNSAPGPASAMGVPPGIAAYLDPSMQFSMDEGLRQLMSQESAMGQSLSGNTLRDILKFSQGLASTNYQQAFTDAAQQQKFGYDVARNDVLDPFNMNLALSGQGLTAQGQLSSLLAQLGLIQSGNLNTLGQTQGAGTVGQNNAVTNAINQILAGLYRNSNAPATG